MAKQVTQQEIQATIKRFERKLTKLGVEFKHVQIAIDYKSDNTYNTTTLIWDGSKFLGHVSNYNQQSIDLVSLVTSLWADFNRLNKESQTNSIVQP